MKNIMSLFQETKMSCQSLKKYAAAIPDLGQGGKTIRATLTMAATLSPNDSSIIDIAPYLGSTTAYLGLGANLSGNKITIHSVDKWLTDKDYLEKAIKYHPEITFYMNEDIQPRWDKNINPFRSKNCSIIGTKTDVIDWKPKVKNISVYVDDICHSKIQNNYVIKYFSPYFIPNKTVLFLMDYYFYERNKPECQYQHNFMTHNKKAFCHIGRIGKTQTAVFIYLGGKITYDIPEQNI
jgi:hypothetical protein